MFGIKTMKWGQRRKIPIYIIKYANRQAKKPRSYETILEEIRLKKQLNTQLDLINAFKNSHYGSEEEQKLVNAIKQNFGDDCDCQWLKDHM